MQSRLGLEMQPTTCALTQPVADGAQAMASVGIVDLSFLGRFGVKGPGAAAALQALGFVLPTGPNRWAVVEGGGLIARLGRSEFLIEDGISGSSVPRVRTALVDGAPGVFPVPRHDLALALVGAQVPKLWEQTCSFDLRELAATPGLVVMTTMIGVSVTIVRDDLHGREGLRVWCDATFGPYFLETLLEIARELEGGAVLPNDFQPPTGRDR